jgi:hypothetical protein
LIKAKRKEKSNWMQNDKKRKEGEVILKLKKMIRKSNSGYSNKEKSNWMQNEFSKINRINVHKKMHLQYQPNKRLTTSIWIFWKGIQHWNKILCSMDTVSKMNFNYIISKEIFEQNYFKVTIIFNVLDLLGSKWGWTSSYSTTFEKINLEEQRKIRKP